MKSQPRFHRRDFLKLLAAVSGGVALSQLQARMNLALDAPQKQNIIIILFDAMSARHLSLYGYGRGTTPNFSRFAERAIVYHSHYSGGSFTTSGTASLLTGTLPWTHRAINLGSIVKQSLVDENVFHWIGNEYYRLAFSQNAWADLLLSQFGANVDRHLPLNLFRYKSLSPLFSVDLPKDQVMAHYALDEFLGLNYKELSPLPGSFTLGVLSALMERSGRDVTSPSKDYPYGMPYNSLYYYYQNRVVFQGVQDAITGYQGPSPLFAYFHLFSPHAPYAPTKPFTGLFPQVLKVPFKPVHPLAYMHYNQKKLTEYRLHYDEYIANVDAEFGVLMDALEQAGILDRSYVVVTSDHGEVFERGEVGHGTALLYDPVIHIPLMISVPGQTQRVDVHAPTSSADVAPTLASLTGQSLPKSDGKLLPGLGGDANAHRSIFSVEAKESSAFSPLRIATISLLKDNYHMIYYKGYRKYPEVFELYDLSDNIEEQHNIYAQDTTVAAVMKEELMDALSDADRPYQRG